MIASAVQPAAAEAALEARFAVDRVGGMINEFLEVGTPYNLRELTGDRQFVVAYIDAESPFADIPRSVETPVFSKTFKLPLTEIVEDYGKYDPASTFATVIDIKPEIPRAAGALRITEYDPSLGFKDVNDLVIDDPDENPWIEEIKSGYFADGEPYDPMTAWQRLAVRASGAELVLSESLDIATHASAEDYQGEHGDLNGTSMLFYHACLRYALAKRAKNLLAIFDLKPLDNLQQFGDPFDTYEGLKARPYGGPGDTMPAFCVINEGTDRIRKHNADVGRVFIDGQGLDQIGLLPNEYLPEQYSNEAVNL